ncbi:MAG: ABC transporter permease [Oscillospiraceae bacterium]|jgi:simple sugar transport system permease protein|nr:ABC transporter permease [Oscillospiraceae bacterium]
MGRKTKTQALSAVAPIFSIIVALLASALFVMWAKSMSVSEYFSALRLLLDIIITESLSTPQKFMEVLVYATPLLFCGLAHIICFRCGLFNIGVEGQFIMGMVGGALIGQLQGVPMLLHIALMVLAGIICGGLWGFLPGILKAKRGTNEVVVCIMTNFIAMYISNYIALRSVFADSQHDSSYTIQPHAQLPRFVPTSRLNISVFMAIILAFCVYLLLFWSKRGFQIRAVGLNASAAEAGGVNTTWNIVLALVISGAIAGVGGALQISGVQTRLISMASFPNYGFDAIPVALLCNKNPLACVLVAILFGALRNCSRMFQIEGIPKDIVYVIQAIIIFFVAADLITKHLNKRRRA